MSNILYVKNSLIFNANGELIKDADITKFKIEDQCLSEQRNTFVALSNVPNLTFKDKEWVLQKLEESQIDLSDETLCLTWIAFPATNYKEQQIPTNYVNYNGIILRNMKKPVMLTKVVYPVLTNNVLNLNSIITTPEKLYKCCNSSYVYELIDKAICISLLSVMPQKYFEKECLQNFCSRFALRLDDTNIRTVLSHHKTIVFKYLSSKHLTLDETMKLLTDMNDESYEGALMYLLTTDFEIPESLISKVHDVELYKNYVCNRKMFDTKHLTHYNIYKDINVIKCALNSFLLDPAILDMLDEQTVKNCIKEIAAYCEETGKDFTPTLLTHINSLCKKESINNNDLYSIIRTVLMSSEPNRVEIISSTLYASCIYHVLANIIDSEYNEEKLSYLEIAKLLCRYSTAEIVYERHSDKHFASTCASCQKSCHQRTISHPISSNTTSNISSNTVPAPVYGSHDNQSYLLPPHRDITPPPPLYTVRRALSPIRRNKLGSSASPEPEEFESTISPLRMKPKFNDKFKPTLEVIRNFFEPTGDYPYMTLYHIAIKRGKEATFPIELCPEPVPSLGLVEFARHYQVILPRNRTDVDLYKIDLRASESGIPTNSVCVYEFPFAGNDCYVITSKNLKEDMSRRVYVSKNKTADLLFKASRHEFIRRHMRVLPDEDWKSESASSPKLYLAVSRSDVTLDEIESFLEALN